MENYVGPERRSGMDRRVSERRKVDIPPFVYEKKERPGGNRRSGKERRTADPA